MLSFGLQSWSNFLTCFSKAGQGFSLELSMRPKFSFVCEMVMNRHHVTEIETYKIKRDVVCRVLRLLEVPFQHGVLEVEVLLRSGRDRYFIAHGEVEEHD